MQLNNGVVEPWIRDGGHIEFKPRCVVREGLAREASADAELAKERDESDAEPAKMEMEAEVVAKRLAEVALTGIASGTSNSNIGKLSPIP